MVRPVKDYSGVDEALAGVKARIRASPVAEFLGTVASFGRISAADVRAPRDLPPFATSHMDGFAVRSEDLKGTSKSRPAKLDIIGQSGLGEAEPKELGRGDAIRVATGSRIPNGADTIVQAELAEIRGSKLLVGTMHDSGAYIYGKGQDVKRGEVVLVRGRPIRSQDIGLLLGLGILKVKVWRRPRVAVLATGSELTDAARPTKGKTRDSHSPVFLQLVKAQGCQPVSLGIAEDEPEAVSAKLRKGLKQSDFVLTLGGTSVGGYDVVGDSVSRLNPDVFFHGIRMDRGRVTGIAVVNGRPVLMMPGPIQGAMNAFLLFGVPLIRHLGGRTGPELTLRSRLSDDWKARRGFVNFQKVVHVRLRVGEGLAADPLSGATESMRVLRDADGYFVVPEGVASLKAGSSVDVNLLPGFSSA